MIARRDSFPLRLCGPAPHFSEAGGSGPPGDLLVVRHGRGRGPHIRLRSVRHGALSTDNRWSSAAVPAACTSSALLEHPASRRPTSRASELLSFYSRIPLRERFSECFDEASEAGRAGTSGGAADRQLAGSALELHQERASETVAAGRLAHRTAHLLFENHEELRAAIREVSFPAILRADRLHSQARMLHLESREDALNLGQDAITLPGTLSPVVDTREGFRQADPGSAWARFYHKKRAFVFGRHVVNNHVFFGGEPIVAAKSLHLQPLQESQSDPATQGPVWPAASMWRWTAPSLNRPPMTRAHFVAPPRPWVWTS